MVIVCAIYVIFLFPYRIKLLNKQLPGVVNTCSLRLGYKIISRTILILLEGTTQSSIRKRKEYRTKSRGSYEVKKSKSSRAEVPRLFVERFTFALRGKQNKVSLVIFSLSRKNARKLIADSTQLIKVLFHCLKFHLKR